MIQLRLGTRRSRLALIQSEWVANRIREVSPGTSVELVEIATSGDQHPKDSLGPHLGQSIFTKEIEDGLLDGRIDLAVHSCKDLATGLPDGLILSAVPPREDPRDAVVSAHGRLEELPEGARVGTSSPRRRGFLSVTYPHLVFSDQRGNVPTRIAAVDRGEYDASILAVAGLTRSGLSGRITEVLSTDLILPAASQGALAVQVRADDPRTYEVTVRLDHAETHAEVTAERACLRGLEAGCQAPVGVLARIDGPELTLEAGVVAPTGIVRVRGSGPIQSADEIGLDAAGRLLGDLDVRSLHDISWITSSPPTESVE